MKYSLDIYVVSDNDAIMNAAKNLIPEQNSPGIFLIGCRDIVDGIDMNGNRFIRAIIQYEPTHKAERDSAFSSLKGLDGLFNNCIDGYVRKHICYNRPEGELSPQPCIEEEIYRCT